MTPPVVTVFKTKFANSWPRKENGECGRIEDLGWALEDQYPTDAHMVAYESTNSRRLGREAIGKLPYVAMRALIFDVDCPKELKADGAAPDDWRGELLAKVQKMAERHPGTFYYETRGGARFIYAMRQPWLLKTEADAARWSRSYTLALEYFKAEFGIEADPACADWQRMYRLPDTVRDGVRQQWGTWGSPHSVAALRIGKVSAEAFAQAKWTAKAWKAPAARLDFAQPAGVSGEGLLFYLLSARGSIVRPLASEAHTYIIRCPNEAQHSSGKTGDSSTVLYPPAAGESVGMVHCKHGHCQDLKAGDWLKFFSETEIAAAELAAGQTPTYDRDAALVDLAQWKASK